MASKCKIGYDLADRLKIELISSAGVTLCIVDTSKAASIHGHRMVGALNQVPRDLPLYHPTNWFEKYLGGNLSYNSYVLPGR